MSKRILEVFVGLTLSLFFIAACNNQKDDTVKVSGTKDHGDVAKTEGQKSVEAETAKASENNELKGGIKLTASDVADTALLESILCQAHPIFKEVWKKIVEGEDVSNKDPMSVFSYTKQALVSLGTAVKVKKQVIQAATEGKKEKCKAVSGDFIIAKENETSRELILRAKQVTETCLELNSDLVHFTRLAEDKMKIEFVPTNLSLGLGREIAILKGGNRVTCEVQVNKETKQIDHLGCAEGLGQDKGKGEKEASNQDITGGYIMFKQLKYDREGETTLEVKYEDCKNFSDKCDEGSVSVPRVGPVEIIKQCAANPRDTQLPAPLAPAQSQVDAELELQKRQKLQAECDADPTKCADGYEPQGVGQRGDERNTATSTTQAALPPSDGNAGTGDAGSSTTTTQAPAASAGEVTSQGFMLGGGLNGASNGLPKGPGNKFIGNSQATTSTAGGVAPSVGTTQSEPAKVDPVAAYVDQMQKGQDDAIAEFMKRDAEKTIEQYREEDRKNGGSGNWFKAVWTKYFTRD